MAITIIGNHSRGFKSSGPGGVGAHNVPAGLGWCSVSASAASDTAVLGLASLVRGDINQGIFFQSDVAATVEFTLSNPAVALSPDPAVNGSARWGNSTALAADVIKQAPISAFTACRITFSAAGTVCIGSL